MSAWNALFSSVVEAKRWCWRSFWSSFDLIDLTAALFVSHLAEPVVWRSCNLQFSHQSLQALGVWCSVEKHCGQRGVLSHLAISTALWPTLRQRVHCTRFMGRWNLLFLLRIVPYDINVSQSIKALAASKVLNVISMVRGGPAGWPSDVCWRW